MIDPLEASFSIATSGLAAQSQRLRVVSENIANAQSTGQSPGADPYTRKTISFDSEMNRTLGVELVKVQNIGQDNAPFKITHDPGNPAADSEGNVKFPNVDMLVEMADMREANRSYEANLQVYKQTRELVSMTIDLLKG